MAPLVTTTQSTQQSEMTTQTDINTSSTSTTTATTASTTTTPTRGRTRTANPIGLSRQSSSFYESTNNNNNDQQRSRSASVTRRSSETTPRSNSLTRVQSSLDLSSHGIMRRSNSFSDVRPLTLQRTNSFTSVNSNNTSNSAVEEPMWFSHAFGSGVKVDLVDHPELASVNGSVNNFMRDDDVNDNMGLVKDVTGDDNSLENGCNQGDSVDINIDGDINKDGDNEREEQQLNNSSPKLLERSDTGVISVDSSVTSGYSGPSFGSNDDLEDIDTSARGVRDEIQEEEQSVARSVREMKQCISDIDNSNNVEEIETPSSTPSRLTMQERKQQLFDDEMNDTGDSNTTKKKRIGTLSDLNRLLSADNLKKKVGPQRQQSQGTLDSSFDIDQGMSIQSELLGAGEDRPSALRPVHNNKQQCENDVSSITMDHLPTNPVSSPTTPAPPFHGSIHQWEEHNNTTQSWLTTQQQQSSPKAKRSFVTNVKAHTIDKISKTRKKNINKSSKSELNNLDDSSTDSPQQQRPQGRRRGRSLGLKKRVSRKGGIQQNNNPHPYNKKESDESQDDRKVRERSRSIVRDALSFMESIDNDDSGDGGRLRVGHREGRSLPPPRSRRLERSEVTVTSSDTTVSRGRQGLHIRHPSSDSTNSSDSSREEEASIQSNLQQQITDLTNERNALRTNSERLMEVLTQQKSELETELANERKGFANVSHSQKKEIEELKNKAKKMERKCKKMEGQLKSSKGIERKDTHNESIFSLDMSTSELGNEALHLASTFGVDMSSTLSSSDTTTQAEKNLHFALLKMSELEARHAEQIQQLQSDNTCMKGGADEMKTKYDELNRKHQDLLNVRDDETAAVSALENKLEGYRIVIESLEKAETSDQSDTSAKNVNDELVEKIGDLADTNGQLLAKCQRLEREIQSQSLSSSSPLHHLTKELELCQMKNIEASTTIETLQVENRNLRSSLATQGLDSSLKSEDSSVTAEAVKQVLEDEEGGNSNKKPTDIEHEEALAMIQAMQLENDTLHASMEEAVELATGMNVKMSNFVKTHEASSKEYEEKIKTLKTELSEAQLSKDELSTKLEFLQNDNKKLSSELEEANGMVVSSVRDEIAQEQLSKETWDKEKRELSVAMNELKKENKTLHESMKEMNSLVTTAEECVDKLTEENATLKQTQEFYEQQYEELNTEKESNTYLRDEIKGISMEREEAYETCKVLQQEINVLRQSVKETKLPEHLHSDGSILTTDDYRFAELTKANESLNNELEKKNAALQAVQSALESLKEEQSTIKETIVELRTENAKLLTAQQVLALPPPPRSKKPKSSSSGDSSDSSIILKLESQVKKIHKENKGLREANNTLSAKLFDEMERTDALRVANEGLAARICKLVAFIQQTPNSSANASIGGGGGGGNASASSGGSSGKSGSRRGSKSPARQKKKK